MRRRLLGSLVGIGLALAGLSFAACSAGEKEIEQAAKATATAVPQSTPTPSATRRPWAFLGTRRLMTAVTPTDLELYRSLLPAEFDMPDQPLMIVAVAYYYGVTPPLVPYHEGYVLLQCKYQGTTGFYTYTMPVDDKTANDGGRSIGFNKYVADKIMLDEQGGVWTGRVVAQGRTAMEVTFTPRGEATTESSGQDSTVLFNLVPPAEGPQVIEVTNSPSGNQVTVTTQGTATIKADPSEAWAGLLKPDGSTDWAVFQVLTGDSTLSPRLLN
jgi:acetoacetate decarboxylase